MVTGSTATANTSTVPRPFERAVQVVPPSVLPKTPLSVAAQRTAPFPGSSRMSRTAVAVRPTLVPRQKGGLSAASKPKAPADSVPTWTPLGAAESTATARQLVAVSSPPGTALLPAWVLVMPRLAAGELGRELGLVVARVAVLQTALGSQGDGRLVDHIRGDAGSNGPGGGEDDRTTDRQINLLIDVAGLAQQGRSRPAGHAGGATTDGTTPGDACHRDRACRALAP